MGVRGEGLGSGVGGNKLQQASRSHNLHLRYQSVIRFAAERGGNTLDGFNNFHTENGSRPRQNLVLAGLFGPSWLESGFAESASLFVAATFMEMAIQALNCRVLSYGVGFVL